MPRAFIQLELGHLWDNLSKMETNQLWFVIGILVVVGLFFLAYKAFVPGTVRQASSDKDRDDAIGILKAQLSDAMRQKEEAERRKEDAEKREQAAQERLNVCELKRTQTEWRLSNLNALRELVRQLEAQEKPV